MSESTAPEAATAVSESPVATWLIERVRFYDQVDAETITLDAPLAELGLDSIYVMTLCGDIEDAYDITIDPGFFADYATLGELADGLSTRIASA